MPNDPVRKYFEECALVRRSGAGTPETAYYPALKELLDAAGASLKPKVRCIMSLRDQGAGLPDGGLFTVNQLPKRSDEPEEGTLPERGAIECKKVKDEVVAIADTAQVTRYWNRYRQVLVTNFREFLLVGSDGDGKPVRHEFHVLAKNPSDFARLCANPAQAAAEHGPRLLDFLKRCLLRPAPLTDPKDVAWFLASYARDARARVEHAHAHERLVGVRKALEDALGLKVTDAKGEHFFQSTLVQTLFYGVFSAWVLWHRSNPKPGSTFDWEKAHKYLHVPVLRKLFREMADDRDLTSWDNLTEVLQWAADALNRVDRGAFFAKFVDAEAVQYFYEPFLEAFDPELRKQLGVWYTPPEIVKYMVSRVDQVLKSDFDRPAGLADPDVYILDPCCGTAAYVVEVLDCITRTLAEQGEEGLLAERLKQAATDRVFGFEILPAPFVVAHLQIGLFLQRHGAAFDDKKNERAAVYLTNALTGWSAPDRKRDTPAFPELQEERDLADNIKQGKPIIVVLGNPPYNGFAGLPAEEEAGLVEPYRKTKRAPKPQGQGLNDLYVRFFRIAERCITERNARHGIICYISNYSWLDGLSHTGLRERFLEEFDQIWVDCLNGDKYKTGKTTPEGNTDPSVFSTPHNREGIQVGTAVALLERTPKHTSPAKVAFRDFWGEAKRAELAATIGGKQRKSLRVKPVPELGLAFRPMATDANYTTWPLIADLFPTTFPGIFTARDQFVVDMSRSKLEKRVRSFFDPSISHEEMRQISAQAMLPANRYEPIDVRTVLQKRGIDAIKIVKFDYRPFDTRWLYWEPDTKLLNEKRTEYFWNVFEGNSFITATQQNRKDFDAPLVLQHHATLHIIERGANMFPMLLRLQPTKDDIFANQVDPARMIGENVANISDAGFEYLRALSERRGLPPPKAGAPGGEKPRRSPIDLHPELFHHVIAILHAPEYAQENAAALRQDWPRVPLPSEAKQLLASAQLGRRVAALLDPEAPADGVTAGKIPAGLKSIGAATKGSGQLSGRDFAVTARWGISGKGGITMPSTGKVHERAFTTEEAAALGPDALKLLGPDTLDVFLNDKAHWRNVPRRVWEYTLGGYQVLKKWLSYREEPILGRPLTVDEVSYITQVARRIAALVLLGPELDADYRAVKAATWEWAQTRD